MAIDSAFPDLPVQGRILGIPLKPEHCGKCASCGFLSRAVRSGLTVSYKQVDWLVRYGMEPFFSEATDEAKQSTSPEHPNPECFLHAVNLPDELGVEVGKRGGGNWNAGAQSIFWKDRHCSEWFLYSPGMNPKRHFERYEMQRLEQSRRDFELRLFELSQKLQADSLRTARWNFWASVIFGIIVVVLSIMQVWLASRPNVIIQVPSQQSEPVVQESPPTSR